MTTQALPTVSLKLPPLTGKVIEAPKPPRFDPYRIAATPSMKELVEEVTRYCLNVEQAMKLRKRARRPNDLKVFQGIVEALVCDLAYQHLTGHASIRVTRGKDDLARASRYTSELLSEQLPYILDLLHQRMGFIRMELGTHSAFGGKQTEVAPTPWLVTRFTERSLTIYDTDRREGEELILLKGTKVAQARADLAEYEDDELTNQYRAEVQLINRYLRQADISYDLDLSNAGLLVDERNRHLRRIFTRESFGSGGRLFGGFWQSLGKAERLANTTINGEPVVSIDYKSMIATLAYARLGVTPAADDAYTFQFDCIEHEERVVKTVSRNTVKRLMAACFFAESELKQWPRGLQREGLAVSTVIAGIKVAHPALVPLFFQGLGHVLQFAESEILVDVMLHLIEKDIPALPVHDCVVVPESAQEIATEIMLNVFEFHQHAPAKIAVERAD